MRSFRRSSSAAPMPAPPPPAPVAQPAMPNPYLRNLPQPTQVAQPVGLDQQRVQQPQPVGLQQRLMQQAQPNLSGAMGQLRAGDNVAAQNTMRQIVGLPPLPAAPQMANPSLADAIALGKTGDQAGMQRMMQQIVGLPPSGAPQQPKMQQTVGPGLIPQGNLFNPMQQPGMQQRQFPQPGQMGQMTDFQRSAMEMQQRQAQIASQMRPQPGMQQTVGPGLTPQGNLQPGFLGGIQPGQMTPLGGMPAGQQFAGNPMEMQQAALQYAQMQMQQRQFPQPGQMGPQQPGLTPMPFPQPGQMGPQQPGLTPMPFPQPGMQPQQPNSLGQQFGQAQNPFARPMQQQAFGQSSMPQGIGQSQQQSFGQAQQPSNIMSSKFGSAFGGGTQPQQQPQQPGMQQNNPMQKAGGSTGRTGLF